MKIVYNNLIPFKGYKAINLFGVLFARKNSNLSQIDINHEEIHTKQIRELLYIGFYIWYLIEWLIRLFKKGNAYHNIAFEKEAYFNQNKFDYCETRLRYSFLKYYKDGLERS